LLSCHCQASYIGETGRNLSTRLTQQKQATRNGDINNHIAEHHLKTKHQIDWDSATCITYSTDYYQHLTLESWFTNLEQTPLNRSQQLPATSYQLPLTLKMTTAQVVETSVTVNNNSPIHDYAHPDDQTQPFEYYYCIPNK